MRKSKWSLGVGTLILKLNRSSPLIIWTLIICAQFLLVQKTFCGSSTVSLPEEGNSNATIVPKNHDIFSKTFQNLTKFDNIFDKNATNVTPKNLFILNDGFDSDPDSDFLNLDWSWGGMSNVSEGHGRRVKRGHGTCVGALGLRQALSSGQATSVNTAGTNEAARERRRRKRSPSPRPPLLDVRGTLVDYALSRIYRRVRPFGEPMQTSTTAVVIPLSIPVNVANAISTQTQTVQSSLPTRTQQAFARINFDIALFIRFTESPLIQRETEIKDRFVLDPSGVTCEEACRQPGTVFALVGICTTDYCRCGGGARNEVFEYSCNTNQVFDPVRMSCRDPRKTELCSDGAKNRGVVRSPSQQSSSSSTSSKRAVPPSTSLDPQQQQFQWRQQQLTLERQHYELQQQQLQVERQLERTKLQELYPGYYPPIDESSPYSDTESVTSSQLGPYQLQNPIFETPESQIEREQALERERLREIYLGPRSTSPGPQDFVERERGRDRENPTISGERGRERENPAFSGQRERERENPSFSGERERYRENPSFSGERERYRENPSFSGERERYRENPSFSGQRERERENPSFSGERERYRENPPFSGERERYRENPPFSGERERYRENPSFSGERERDRENPPFSGERERYPENLPLSGERERDRENPSFSGPSPGSISNPPGIAHQEQLLLLQQFQIQQLHQQQLEEQQLHQQQLAEQQRQQQELLQQLQEKLEEQQRQLQKQKQKQKEKQKKISKFQEDDDRRNLRDFGRENEKTEVHLHLPLVQNPTPQPPLFYQHPQLPQRQNRFQNSYSDPHPYDGDYFRDDPRERESPRFPSSGFQNHNQQRSRKKNKYSHSTQNSYAQSAGEDLEELDDENDGRERESSRYSSTGSSYSPLNQESGTNSNNEEPKTGNFQDFGMSDMKNRKKSTKSRPRSE